MNPCERRRLYTTEADESEHSTERRGALRVRRGRRDLTNNHVVNIDERRKKVR
jgi:hypothetical protein